MIIEKIVNVETGEETIIEREETAEETSARELAEQKAAEAKAKANAETEAKAALLSKLGITEEEAQLLLS